MDCTFKTNLSSFGNMKINLFVFVDHSEEKPVEVIDLGHIRIYKSGVSKDTDIENGIVNELGTRIMEGKKKTVEA